MPSAIAWRSRFFRVCYWDCGKRLSQILRILMAHLEREPERSHAQRGTLAKPAVPEERVAASTLFTRAQAMPIGIADLDILKLARDPVDRFDDSRTLARPTPVLQLTRANFPSSCRLEPVEMRSQHLRLLRVWPNVYEEPCRWLGKEDGRNASKCSTACPMINLTANRLCLQGNNHAKLVH